MLTYSFTDIGSDSLYEYLYKCIKKDILNGTLSTGEKLPSKRTFAKNLNISTITVENAYAQLIAEGYIYSLPKKGYFVSDISSVAISPIPYDNSANASDKLTASTIQQNNIDNLKLSKNTYFADFVSNSVLPDNFPFSIWTKLIREVISEESSALMTNPPCGGILELRNAIAKYLLQFRGIKVSPTQIIVGAGTEYIYSLLIQLFTNHSSFAVEEPGHKKIAQIYNSYHVKYYNIPLDNLGVDMNALENSSADILHISPSHHYPTGIVTPISRRYEILQWASKSPLRYIIEDDYDCEFRLQGNPIPSLKSIDTLEKVIYINTFSKSLASTIRISYMVLPKHLLKRFYSKLGFYSCTVSNFEQYTLAKFINKGYFEKHINRQRNYYKKQRDILLKCIADSPLASHCTITEKDSGLHFLMKIDTELSDLEFKEMAQSKGLHVAFLSEYYNESSPAVSHILVINYSGIETEKIPMAISLLSECI